MAFTHEAILKRRDIFEVDPRMIRISSGWNPRKDLGSIDELMESIISNGVIEPITVRNLDDTLYVVDGERRMRATLEAIKRGHDIKSIPATLARRGISDSEAMILAVVKNGGKPLLPSEEASAYQRLRSWGMTVAEIAKRVGRSQAKIYNSLKLVDASNPVKEAVDTKQIGQIEARKIVMESQGDLEKQAEKLRKAKQRQKDDDTNDEEGDFPKRVMKRSRMIEVFTEVYNIAPASSPVKDAVRKGIALGIYMALHDIRDYIQAQEAYAKDGFKL